MKLYTLLLGSALANYDTYVIPIDNSAAIEWRDPDNLLEFLEKEGNKEFVKYQEPNERYVPIKDLPIVYLNGLKFHRQGKQPRPSDLERFQKMTRTTSGKLICEDAEKARSDRGRGFMPNDAPVFDDGFRSSGPKKGFDMIAREFQTEYPRYNGVSPKALPNPLDDLEEGKLNLADLTPENEQESAIAQDPTLDFANLDPQQGGFVSEIFSEPEEDFEAISNLSGEILEGEEVDLTPRNAAEFALTKEELRLERLKKKFYSQEKVKIGCCNGTPYNSKKRCCCRRVSFDKDKKFCCAINGCESFQIFDRSNAQHYKDCLSLSGLVIQEYGYRGQAGQPKMDFVPRARP